ncbi:MAG TPA: peptide MFS transporter [Flavobacteriales bacterium]|nr:peptide MFS transporter [Flavobacteriales bacterium]HRP80904.1 peptide MFS transporter [Flavobacteriales bacterium]HRQ84824.1 peptide MFS transporter [Flavobacteriales bacterium]
MEQDISIQSIRDFKGKYPKQLWHLAGSEMWERFCFYGMRGMLVVFMVNELGLESKVANLQYGAIQAFVYAFTFVGGLFADKILGFQKSLFWGAAMMILGGLVIAFSPHDLFYIGICFSIIGTGFFKPNISTMVGQLYHDGDARRDAGFSLFYSGINAGALLGGSLMIYVGKKYSWQWAFLLVSIVMTISLLNFWFYRKHMGPIGLSPLRETNMPKARRIKEVAVYIGTLLSIPLILLLVTNTQYTDLFMYIIGPAALAYLFWIMRKLTDADGTRGNGTWLTVSAALVLLVGVLLILDTLGSGLGATVTNMAWAATGIAIILAMISGNAVQKRLHAALVFIIFSIVFWALYEQAGGSLSIFALNNIRHELLGFIPMDPNVVNNGANALFVILFAPLIGLLWIWLGKRKLEPNSVVKFGLGFLLLGAAFYVFYSTVFFATTDGMTSMNVFTAAYLVITLGELCLSPIGLSLMTKLSPQSIQGLMMGMWFLASAYGQYVAGLLGAEISVPDATPNLGKLIAYTNGYKEFALYGVLLGIALIAVSPLIRKLMKGVH